MKCDSLILIMTFPNFDHDGNLTFSPFSEMKLHEPKPSGLMANPAFANVVNMKIILNINMNIIGIL